MAAKFENLTLQDFELLDTLGTGSFGRVRLSKYKPDSKYYALKILKKSEVSAGGVVRGSRAPGAEWRSKYAGADVGCGQSQVIYLKQVEHVKTEKRVLLEISNPFIVNLMGAFQDPLNL